MSILSYGKPFLVFFEDSSLVIHDHDPYLRDRDGFVILPKEQSCEQGKTPRTILVEVKDAPG